MSDEKVLELLKEKKEIIEESLLEEIERLKEDVEGEHWFRVACDIIDVIRYRAQLDLIESLLFKLELGGKLGGKIDVGREEED